jgi:signal transduction histidine kinase
MANKNQIRLKIEDNGLILIALMMVVIYWTFDFISSGHYLTRTLIAVLVIVYGAFTQTLINSRKKALAEKEEAQKRLIHAERLAALGSVAAGVAHEVKNPLAILLQGIEFMKNALKNDARLLDVTQRMEKTVHRVDNIIKGLLSYSRDISLKMEELDIVPIIEETLSFMDHQIDNKHIHVKKQHAPNLPKIIIDSDQIKQVFTNVFMNAIEAMDDGGILGIRIDADQDEKKQPHVKIAVSDTGKGIDEGVIRKIFDPFFTTKSNERNTGLGLSISKGIIDKHRGTIEIESEPGRGTRVIIGLPAGLE